MCVCVCVCLVQSTTIMMRLSCLSVGWLAVFRPNQPKNKSGNNIAWKKYILEQIANNIQFGCCCCVLCAFFYIHFALKAHACDSQTHLTERRGREEDSERYFNFNSVRTSATCYSNGTQHRNPSQQYSQIYPLYCCFIP